jgi:hypothetical protein
MSEDNHARVNIFSYPLLGETSARRAAARSAR